MKKTLDAPVVDVVVDCHRRLRAAAPGSEVADVAEHAISLALSPDRSPKDSNLLLHDVLRQARHSVRRSRARRARVVDDIGHLASQGVRTVAGIAQSAETPETVVIAREQLRELSDYALCLGGPAPRVLAGMLAGETVRDTVLATGVSSATVERIQRRIRAAASREMTSALAA